MTLSPFLVYLAMQMDEIKFAFVLAIGVLFLIILVLGLIRPNVLDNKEDSRLARMQKHCVISIFLCLAIEGFLPNTKTIGAMIIVPTIAESKHLKALPDDVLAFLRGIIREYTPRKETNL